MYEVQSRLSCRQRVPSRSGSIKGTGERSAGGGRGGAEEEVEGMVEVAGRTSGPSFNPGCDPRPEGGQGPAAPIITHYYALNNISEYCPYRDLFCRPTKYMFSLYEIYALHNIHIYSHYKISHSVALRNTLCACEQQSSCLEIQKFFLLYL